MTHLTAGFWSKDHFHEVYNEVCIIQDMMFEAGYSMSDVDVYKAWMAGNDNVWEHPYDYDDDDAIVNSVLTCTSPWEDEVDFPVEDEADPGYRALSDEEWDAIFKQMEEDDDDDYEPGQNACVEGYVH